MTVNTGFDWFGFDWFYRDPNVLLFIQVELSAGKSAIFDATNHTRAQRAKARQLASEANARAVVVYVQVPVVEAKRRWLANRVDPRRCDVRDENFLEVLGSFEEPDEDELRSS